MRTIEEYRQRQAEIARRMRELDREFAGSGFPDAARSEWDDLREERARNDRILEELVIRSEYLAEAGDDDRRSESGAHFNTPRAGVARGEDIYDLTTVRMSAANPAGHVGELRDRAMRSVEAARFPHERADRASNQARIERLLDQDDRGALSELLLVTGSETYRRAFGKALTSAPLSADEQDSLSRAMVARALTTGGANGGYAVPYTLDPTIIDTSEAAVNPYRAISRVEQITTTEWRGLTSAGVTAEYVPEGTEARDNSPTLGNPIVRPERAQSFVPFTIEIGQDWTGLQPQLARMFQKAKDRVEAEKFTVGDGSDEPQGVVTGATRVVRTIAANTVGVGDLYAMEGALPAGWRTLAQWVATRGFYSGVRQLDTSGGASLWQTLERGLANNPTGNTGAKLIGYPANEASYIASGVTSGAKVAILGDFENFVIVDRIGLTVEIIPHLMGENGRPTGTRGLYAIWRNTSEVLVPDAFRVLEIRAP